MTQCIVPAWPPFMHAQEAQAAQQEKRDAQVAAARQAAELQVQGRQPAGWQGLLLGRLIVNCPSHHALLTHHASHSCDLQEKSEELARKERRMAEEKSEVERKERAANAAKEQVGMPIDAKRPDRVDS